jgi:hypothetical protein
MASSLIDAAGGTGALIKEFKDALWALVAQPDVLRVRDPNDIKDERRGFD